MTRIVTLTLCNAPAEVGRMLDQFEAFAACNQISAAPAAEIALALDEVVSNVVNYAWTDARRHTFSLSFSIEDRGFTARLVDDGVAYDPSRGAPAPVPGELEDWTVGGLGIYLARAVVDKLEYRREDELNHLTLFKNLPSPEDSPKAGARPR